MVDHLAVSCCLKYSGWSSASHQPKAILSLIIFRFSRLDDACRLDN